MERLHIAFFGPTNSGKSTLVNAIAGQEVSLVSDVPGTTTDPVRKLIELPGLGPCVLIDTAGLCDDSLLGPERQRRTRAILDETDVAVLLCPSGDEAQVLPMVQEMGHWEQNTPNTAPTVPKSGPLGAVPVIRVMPKADLGGEVPPGTIAVSALTGEGIPELLERLAALRPADHPFLTGRLVKPGDTVLLVMPQDSEAPKGRLILPQVQVLRELLDRGCIPVCCQPADLPAALATLQAPPALVITDSQAFGSVNAILPEQVPLTSFSVLLAASKGDIDTFAEGAKAIGTLRPGDRVLIAEACTHVPDTEDIGRVKIPALLQKRVASRCHAGDPQGVSLPLRIDIAAGNDFPEDLSPYSLIIHCGACVATATLVRARIRRARFSGVPITNYGIALAELTGILNRISLP